MASYYYEKFEKDKITRCPMDDKDGSICGHIVIGLPRWFDENPEERKRLGWIKHITHETSEIEFNRQTQFLLRSVETVDEYTIEDVYHVRDKDAEQMLFEEQLAVATLSGAGGIMFV